jgi:hypothetical protein
MPTHPTQTISARSLGHRFLNGATSAVVAAAAVTPIVAPWLAPAAVLVATLAVAASMLLRPPAGADWLGISVIPRALLIAGVCLLFSTDAIGVSNLVWSILAAAVLLAALVGEVFLRPSVGFQPPIADGLGLSIAFPPPGPPSWLAVAASLIGTVLGIAMGAFGAPGWWWLLLSAAACLPLGRIAAETRGNVSAARVIGQRLPKAVTRFEPAFVVGVAPGAEGPAILAGWLPVLREVGQPFVVATRDVAAARSVAVGRGVAVVEVRSSADLAALDVATVQAVFYLDAASIQFVPSGAAGLDQAPPVGLSEVATLPEPDAVGTVVEKLRALVSADPAPS